MCQQGLIRSNISHIKTVRTAELVEMPIPTQCAEVAVPQPSGMIYIPHRALSFAFMLCHCRALSRFVRLRVYHGPCPSSVLVPPHAAVRPGHNAHGSHGSHARNGTAW